MNILGVFILTLSWGVNRATTYPESWTDNEKFTGVPNRPLAYQHLPSRIPANLPERQRVVYQNWIENNSLPQIANSAPIRQHNNFNSIPLQPQFNEERHLVASNNEPYNLPHQNQMQDFANLDPRKVQNIPVLPEPYRQNIGLREIISPIAKYIQQTPESISYLKRNQEVLNTPVRPNFDAQLIFSNPKIREVLNQAKQTKRYMVVYPDGRVSHVDNVEAVLESNPHHIIISSNELSHNRLDPNFLRQTENKQDQNKEVDNAHSLKNIVSEQKVAPNPIDLILNETTQTNESKPVNNLNSKPVIVVQTLPRKPNNQKTPVQSFSEGNKVENKESHSKYAEVTRNNVPEKSNVSQNKTYNFSNETFVTFNISNLTPYTEAMIREQKNNGLNETNVSQNATSVTLNSGNIQQPNTIKINRVDGVQSNFTRTSNLANKTPKYKGKPNIGPVNPIDIISPILNNTEQSSNNKANKKTDVKPQLMQSLGQIKADKENASEKKTIENQSTNISINNTSTSDVLKNKTDKLSEKKPQVPASKVVEETSKPIATKEDLHSHKLDNKSKPDVKTSNPKQPLPVVDHKKKEKYSKTQNSSENQVEVTSESDDPASKQPEDSRKISASQNENDTSDFVLSGSSEYQDSKYDSEESSKYNWEDTMDPEGEVTSQDGGAWKKVTIKTEDFDIITTFDLPLQPMTIVDSYGESHACLHLLDPTAILSYIICR